jgi:hypothetical protein
MQQTAQYARARGFHEQTVGRLLALAAEDQQVFMDFVEGLKIGENHVRDLLDWLHEIRLRDGNGLATTLGGRIFQEIMTDPRLGRNDKLKRIKEELRRLRFPRLSHIEAEITKRIRALKLGAETQMAGPPGLEGGFLTVHLKAANHAELKRLIAGLAEAVERAEVKEIFELLDGRGVPTTETSDESI